MKKQINPDTKAHLLRGAFYLLLLVTVALIPFALGQRASTKQSMVAALPNGDNPASESWSITGSLTAARYEHTQTLLSNGKVLVAGGFDGFVSLINAELYDPASGTWTPTASLATQRRDHSATLLADGKVLVAGGYTGTTVLATSELYDPISWIWPATGILLANGRPETTAAL